MADYYSADVVVTAPIESVAFDSSTNELADDAAPFRVPMIEEDGERFEDFDHPLYALNDAWSNCGFSDDMSSGLVSMRILDDGKMIEVSASAYEARYGVTQFEDAGLPEALKDAGFEFLMSDEGKYEFPGRALFWKPGMDAVEERVANQDGIVLTSYEARNLIARTTTLDEMIAALSTHFNMDLTKETTAT